MHDGRHTNSCADPAGRPGGDRAIVANNRAVGGAGDGDAYGGGIYNGDSDTLLIRDRIFANSRHHGSLLRGALFGNQKTNRVPRAGHHPARPGGAVFDAQKP